MGKAYSTDLRERAVAAVDREDMSRNQAAVRFGVAVSTAVHWVRRFRETGSVAPGQIGGHKPRILSGANRDWLLARTAGGDFTLRGLVAEPAAGTVWPRTTSAWCRAPPLSAARSRTAWPRRSCGRSSATTSV